MLNGNPLGIPGGTGGVDNVAELVTGWRLQFIFADSPDIPGVDFLLTMIKLNKGAAGYIRHVRAIRTGKDGDKAGIPGNEIDTFSRKSHIHGDKYSPGFKNGQQGNIRL